MGSVYKRVRANTTTWYVDYRIGSRRYRKPAGSTKAMATALLAKIEKELFEGTHYPEKKSAELTVGAMRELWLEKARGKKSFDDDKKRFKAVEAFFGSDTLLVTLEDRDVERFKAHLLETKTRLGRKTSPATVNRHLALLRSALKYAASNGYQHRVRNIKLIAEHNERDRICTPEEYERLLEGADPELRLAIVLGNETGMRLGEIGALTWKQIDLSKRVIKIRQGSTKNGEGRTVPLSKAAVSALEQYPRNLSGRVFEVSMDRLSPRFARLCRKLGIDGLRFHDFRHTAATNLRRAGADIMTIAAVTGHKTLSMMRRYQTITDSDLVAAVDRVSKASS